MRAIRQGSTIPRAAVPLHNATAKAMIGVHVKAGFVQSHGTMSPCLRTRRLSVIIDSISARLPSKIARSRDGNGGGVT